MKKDEIQKELTNIINVMRVMPIDYVKSRFSEHVEKLDNLLVRIVSIKDKKEVLEGVGLFCHLILDYEYSGLDISIRKLVENYIKSKLKNERLRNMLSEYRRAAPELLKFIAGLPAPSLKEIVFMSGVEAKEDWKDPITKKVMNVPVSYVVDTVRYTLDLNTLLHSNFYRCLMLCPITKKIIMFSDVMPRNDIVEDIITSCPNNYSTVDVQKELNDACYYARTNKLEELKRWRIRNIHIDLMLPYLDIKGMNWTVAHNASYECNLEVLCWLAEETCFALIINNSKGKNALNLLKKHLDKLKSACQEQPDNYALQLVLIMYCQRENCPEHIVVSIDTLVDKKYPYALFVHGLQISTIEPEKKFPLFEKGISLIKSSIDLGAKGALAATIQMMQKLKITNEELFQRASLQIEMAYLSDNIGKELSNEGHVMNRAQIEYYYGNVLCQVSMSDQFSYIGYHNIEAFYYLNLASKRERGANKIGLDLEYIESKLKSLGLLLGIDYSMLQAAKTRLRA